MLVPSSTLASRVTVPVLRQHPIDQRGLAGRAVSANNDVANVLDLILGHE